MTAEPIPQGYKQNAQGALVPIKNIKEVDLLRDDVVNCLVKQAKQHAEALARFKHQAMGDIETFIALSLEKYGVERGGAKGNVTLRSFDGRYRIQLAIAEQLVFDERLQAAKNLIDQCLNEWSEGANDNLRLIVNDAFNVDKEGNINTNRVLALRRHQIDHQKWQQAMAAISDSIEVADTKPYIRIYERMDDGRYQRLNLDIAAA